MFRARRLLSYDGGGVQSKILDNVLRFLDWDGHETLFDIGCGSGALTIKAAKMYPSARCVGMDYWGSMWDYTKSNASKTLRWKVSRKESAFRRATPRIWIFLTGHLMRR